MSRETWAIETRGLVKAFGADRAVDGVDLEVPAGCVYSVLGPNGAGKTTMIRMIATLIRPDGGTARVLGHDVTAEAARVRARLALTGQFASLDEDLTGLENLILLARLRGHRGKAARRRATDLLEAFDLSAAARREVKTYSGGMRRRLDIAGSLVARPDLLMLDEPTTGLDPRSRGQVWESVRALVGAGTTVLLTTQYLEEADQLADRIAVVNHGRVIAEGTSGRLKALVGAGALRVRVADGADRPEVARLLAVMLGAAPVLEPDPVALSLRVDEPAAVAGALAAITERGLGVSEYALAQPSLDEVFLALTGEPADGPAPSREEAST
ncbi:daunorubicin resistance protein DrrA family ABC transporter ATP-binding protein [Planobispora rosea]|uniref:Daunorubicin resistance protein DrrA family ABC transporter ATP-binding protein n=1 Tax=Planobispora rosea TaxID=35762 RepID=A0A8J3S3S8_PLARO|nr:ATP-binding cassette domain-containing protein [Planobispora rosea]GGS83870.1 daunorubicin resistance protein DrrA family ABC transporter ATP-binding protein [Planobispora rosea]GIH86294.1 daunorubicin resistance protein DrrA family ABC transporter ATP-binding protein [Planobispora rosea]